MEGKMNIQGIIAAIMTAAALQFPGGAAYAGPPEPEMVLVKGGCFQMGDTFGVGEDDERPVHEVCVGAFYIGKYEVTQEQWMAVMEKNPSKFTGDRRPVEKVSWDDAQQYIEKLNKLTGKNYRLPTETEWEYAARSGGMTEKWVGTSNEKELGEYAWYEKNSGSKSHVVGTKRPNSQGLHDMSGNVWEWCQDRYGDLYYEESPREDPRGPRTGAYRAARGGGWNNRPRFERASNRDAFDPGKSNDNLGFRLSAPVKGDAGAGLRKEAADRREK
jgi:formylglycine-generating enzyme required for sulfatase activity